METAENEFKRENWHYSEYDDEWDVYKRQEAPFIELENGQCKFDSENKTITVFGSNGWNNPITVSYTHLLGKERIEELKYVEKKIREEMILTQRKGNKVVRLVKNIFKVGNRYANEKIVNELTRIFDMLNMHPEEDIESKLINLYYRAFPCWVCLLYTSAPYRYPSLLFIFPSLFIDKLK